jgi:hypothetical protein
LCAFFFFPQTELETEMDYRDVIKQYADDLYDFYQVKIHVDHLVGGIPKDPKMVEAWVNATCKAASAEDRAKIVKMDVEALPEVTSEVLSYSGTTFCEDKGNPCKGLYLEGRQLKSMLKESANIMKTSVPSSKKEGELGITALKSKMADQVFIEEDRVFLDRQKPDRTTQRPISIKSGPQGPQSAIKVSDLCDDVNITFLIRRLRKGEVSEKVLYLCLHYAENIGIGADRSQGFGKFKVEDVLKLSLEQAREILGRGFTPSWRSVLLGVVQHHPHFDKPRLPRPTRSK